MADLPSDLVVAGVAPRADEAAAAKLGGRWRGSLGVIVPAVMVAFIFGLCFIWPLIGPVPSPTGGTILDSNLAAFSSGHFLGTDAVGNDEWARLLYGGRASLEIALAVQAIGLVLGGLIGAVAAYLGGLRDATIMRLLDVVIAFPGLVLAVAIAQGLGPSKLHTIWALCFFSVPATARIARAATLRVREQTFMVAARLSGTSFPRMLLGHIAPNVVPQLLTYALLGMGIIMILEGALSFVGLGVPPPAPSWGNMIAQGQSTLSAQPRYVFLPSAALFITVVSLNLLGEGLRSRWGAQ
ncbi:MAG: ABC transporter permease [Solirubrobacterales bacterium]|nr:ABC transporter permease [Solirubrobacterales bacterium]MBV8946263.1 ABC transporter permease [Solirubrobacterales bacterium]MBV9367727.1 ABC transporter permease [Solirubrobacterales bacterium]